MWSLLSWQNETVTIIINADHVALSWIKPHASSPRQSNLQGFTLQAHTVIPLINLECVNSRLYNLTKLSMHISEFLAAHHLKNAQILMAISGAGIIEQCIACPIATPTAQNFALTKTKSSLVWDFSYLYPADDGNFTFYVCGIQQEILLQYKLLAIAAKLHLKSLITQRMALLQLYRHVQGAVFRHSQLAVTMQRNNNAIEHLCTSETIARLLTINPSLSISMQNQMLNLGTSLGLVISSGYTKENHENN